MLPPHSGHQAADNAILAAIAAAHGFYCPQLLLLLPFQ
jgi:hypothetical protein